MTHETGRDPNWATSYTPFSVDLYDAVQTARGPYAVGGGGTVARKREGSWETVVRDGPSGQGSKLRTVAVTDGGHRVWFAGSSGALGMYDLRNGEKQDYSYTGDATTSWRELAVTGAAGKERALLANGSGVVVSFTVEGTEISFSEPTEPGQGDAVQALETTEDGVGYAVDGAGAAYRATPEGWTNLGTVNASASLTDVYADSSGRLLVSATNGKLYTYERAEETWTPIDVARSALLAVDVFQGHVAALATGATFYSRPIEGAENWHRMAAETGNNLVGFALGYPDIAVGKSGTIVERPRGKPPKEGKKEKEKGEKRDPAPPMDPCRVLTETMLERLGEGEVLELLEEYGCASPFTKTVADRVELRHLAERYHRHGEVLREVTQELLERIRESEKYSLCCALCHEQLVPRRTRRECRTPACTCGKKKLTVSEGCLRCPCCDHAAFYVCRGSCGKRTRRESRKETHRESHCRQPRGEQRCSPQTGRHVHHHCKETRRHEHHVHHHCEGEPSHTHQCKGKTSHHCKEKTSHHCKEKTSHHCKEKNHHEHRHCHEKHQHTEHSSHGCCGGSHAHHGHHTDRSRGHHGGCQCGGK